VLEAEGRALVESSLGARALEVAGLYGVSPLGDAELIARASAKDADERARVAALTALRSRAVGLEARGAAEAALVDSSPAIRRAGRELLEAIDPEAGLARYLESVGAEGDPGERQHAWRRLGAIDDPRAREAIGQGLARWAAGELDPVVALDVIEAGIASGEGALVARARALLEPSPEAPVESRRWALAGGDPVAGRTVFQTVGDCQRCHGDPAAGAGRRGRPWRPDRACPHGRRGPGAAFRARVGPRSGRADRRRLSEPVRHAARRPGPRAEGAARPRGPSLDPGMSRPAHVANASRAATAGRFRLVVLAPELA
jgi:hypothetical protein